MWQTSGKQPCRGSARLVHPGTWAGIRWVTPNQIAFIEGIIVGPFCTPKAKTWLILIPGSTIMKKTEYSWRGVGGGGGVVDNNTLPEYGIHLPGKVPGVSRAPGRLEEQHLILSEVEVLHLRKQTGGRYQMPRGGGGGQAWRCACLHRAGKASSPLWSKRSPEDVPFTQVVRNVLLRG